MSEGARAPIDPLHRVSGPGTAWTRVNIGEGIPGVCTPLNWSWRDEAQERTIRGAYCDMGVIPRVEVPDVRDVDRRASAIFFGRPALNVDVSRALADRQPGTSGDALEELYFGSVRPEVSSVKSRRRYPIVFCKSAPLWARLHRRVDANFHETWKRWRETLDATAAPSLEAARAGFREAHRRFELVTRPHSTLALLVGALTAALRTLAERAGHAEQTMELLGGHDSIELETTRDLARVASGESTMAGFLRRHGYQGPAVGEISSRPWREDPGPLEPLVDSLAHGDASATRDPLAARERRLAAEDAILAGLPGPWRAS